MTSGRVRPRAAPACGKRVGTEGDSVRAQRQTTPCAANAVVPATAYPPRPRVVPARYAVTIHGYPHAHTHYYVWLRVHLSSRRPGGGL
jgi:hypothetical protein